MGMIYAAIVIFALAALVGLFLLTQVLQNKKPPIGVAVFHGLLAVVALVLVIIQAVTTGADLVQIIVIFAIAALGGLVLFIRHITGKSLPRALAIIHGLLAVTGFIFLLAYAFAK